MNPLELVGAEPGPAFTVTLDGREITALPGQTVAAALWAAGVTSWRATRGADARAESSAASASASTAW